jgi:hypothetical protein
MWVEQRKSQFFHWKENLIRLDCKISLKERRRRRRKESKFVTNVIDWTNRTGLEIGVYCLALGFYFDSFGISNWIFKL